MQRREAEATRVDAQARTAQAQVDAKSADAAALQAEAVQRGEHASRSRAEVDERLREADRIDPDVSGDGTAGRPTEVEREAGHRADVDPVDPVDPERRTD